MFSPDPPLDDRARERLQAGWWNRLDAYDQVLELRRHVPAETLGTRVRCDICGRGLAAQATCHACGDETDQVAA